MSKLIFLAVIALLAITAYQAYWLVNIYSEFSAVLRNDIQEAMRASDFEEIISRVERLKDESYGGKMDIKVGPDESREKAVVINEYTPRGADTLPTSPLDEDLDKGEDNKIVYDDFVNMLRSEKDVIQVGLHMQRGIHSGLDLLRPVDVATYDSILSRKLDSLGLRSRHITLLLRDDAGENPDTLAVAGGHVTEEADTFRLDINSRRDMRHELILEKDRLAVPRQMRSMLLFSLFTLLILVLAFWYMIGMIKRMRILDDMKTDFTNNMTHELKTPIAVATAANDVLLDFGHKCSPEKVHKYLSICREQMGLLSELVEQILSLSMERRKQMKLEIEDVEVLPVVEKVVANHILKSGKEPQVEICIPAEMTVRADRRHFSNIVSNLVDNAIKYSPGCPRLIIKGFGGHDGKKVLTVEDNGIGISSERQRFVFDKFYRVPNGNLHDVKGYGLGLYYVRSMMEKFGGSVSLKSEPGNGSVFKLVFNG